MEFDNATVEVLRASGWFPGRSVLTDPWTRKLEPQGFVFHDLALAVLREFGGLTIHPPPSPPTGLFATTDIIFEPVMAADGEFYRVERWQRWRGTPLSPLGWPASLSGMIVIAPDGQVYDSFMSRLFHLGDSFPDALRTLIFADRPVLLDYDPDRAENPLPAPIVVEPIVVEGRE